LELIKSIALGLIQGLTEFLPVSSSGHLVIFEKLLGVEAHNLVFEVLVHLGTLLAVVIYFRYKLFRIIGSFFGTIVGQKVSDEDRQFAGLGWLIILGTIPAVVVGLLARDYIELAFASARWSAGMLLITATILILTRWAKREDRVLNIPRAMLIGIAQALAIMPGISRSGSTISAGIYSGIKKSEAAEFSFLLSVPAILGATVLELPDFVAEMGNTRLIENYLAGAVVAAAVGYISIAFLMNIIKKGKFFFFGLYCAAVGILGIIFL